MNKKIILLVLLLVIIGTVEFHDLVRKKIRKSKHLVDKNSEDITIFSSFEYIDNQFIFDDGDIELKLIPVIEENDNKKIKLKNKQDRDWKRIRHKIERDNNKYKFTLDLSGVRKNKRERVQKVYFDIDWDYDWDIHIENNTVFRFGPKHTSGKYEMDFQDLVDLGYKVRIYNKTVEISNLKGKNLDLDPVIHVTTGDIETVEGCALGDNKVVAGYFDDTSDDFSFQIISTNGTVIVSETDINDALSFHNYASQIAISCKNETLWSATYYNAPTDNVTTVFYDDTGTLKHGPFDISGNQIERFAYYVGVFDLNVTDSVVYYHDNYYRDFEFIILDIYGNQKLGPIKIDDNMGSGIHGADGDASNETNFGFTYCDDADSNKPIKTVFYNNQGDITLGPIKIYFGSSYANDEAMSLVFVNETTWVHLFELDTQNDIFLNIFDIWGNNLVANQTLDTEVQNDPSYNDLARINNTHFGASWKDRNPNSQAHVVCNLQGTCTNDNSVITTGGNNRDNAIVSSQLATGPEICNDNYVHFGSNASGLFMSTHYPNGTLWDGVCIEELENSLKSIVTNVPGSELFWHNGSTINYECGLMIKGQTCTATFWVNATDDINSTHEFYGIVSSSSGSIVNVNSSKLNITIREAISSCTDTTFTLSYPGFGCDDYGSTDGSADCEYCAFVASDTTGATNEVGINCTGQNSTEAFIVVDNQGDCALNISMRMNIDVNISKFRFKVSQNATGWESSCSGGIPTNGCLNIEDTNFNTVATNVTDLGGIIDKEIWMYGDYIGVYHVDNGTSYGLNMTGDEG